MKKALALLLSCVLCLSLYACGVPKQYQPLMEQLEAQNYEGIKTELTALSPEFKADTERMAEYESLMAKYESLLALLEEERYEEALLDVQNRMPVPEYETIEITMDNWQEYFEFVFDYHWGENAFGEGEQLCVGISLYLKEAYAARLPESGNTVIACTAVFDARETTLEVNWKEKTFEEVPYKRLRQGAFMKTLDEGKSLEKSFEEGCRTTAELHSYNLVETDTYPNVFYWGHYPGDADDGPLKNYYYGENISMARITGTLELICD